MNTMLCGYLDDERLWDNYDHTAERNHQQNVEDYADTIMDECKSFKRAASINSDYDLYDGDLLPKLMVEIAKWDGSSMNAAVQMKAMFNLLADEFQKIAEREVK